MSRLTAIGALAALLATANAVAEEKVLNLYSARHYQTDEALYANFTKQTGIAINRIEAKEDELLERIRNEGANSPRNDCPRTCAATTGMPFRPAPGSSSTTSRMSRPRIFRTMPTSRDRR